MKFEVKVGWITSFLEKKIIFPSAPVPGINNDQPLRSTMLNMKLIRLKTKELQSNKIEASDFAIS